MLMTRLSCISFSTLVLVLTSSASAELPADRTIRFTVHETPNDLLGPTVFVVELDVSAQDQEGDSVGWLIQEARFILPGAKNDTVWVDASVDVNSRDGLWWIDHADGSSPQVAEFDSPPELVGQAASNAPAVNNLTYEFWGVHGQLASDGQDLTMLVSAEIHLDAFAQGAEGVDLFVDEEEVELNVGVGSPTRD